MKRWISDEHLTALANSGRLREVCAIGKQENARLAQEWNGTNNVEFVTLGLNKIDREHLCREGGVVNQPTRVASHSASPATSSAAPSKFRNVKTDGYASKKEAARALALRLMQEAGQIRNLREQVEYELIPKQEGERACAYRADFVYDEFATEGWREVVEDTKGVRTADYVIKRKLMLQVHGVRIRET